MTRRHRKPRRQAAASIEQLPWGQIVNHLRPLEILSQDQLEAIHLSSLRILEEIGIEFMGRRAQDVFRRAGADVDPGSGLVRIDRGLIEECLKSAPHSITVTPRNPERTLVLGDNRICTTLVAGPPNVHDCERGRRSGNYRDYCELVSLAQSLNIVHAIGNQPVAPIELPAHNRHLDCYLANVTYADRVYHCSAIGAERALDGIDIAAIAQGRSRDDLVDRPAVLTIISVNSPRRFDESMSEGLMAMSEWGQVVVVTPFTLMGAMTPVTMAGALAQQNAEALSGIALTQLTRPGAPVVYGGFTSNVDMKSGAPAFGTPENVQATLAGGQLARRYGLPYRSSNSSASNVVDAQAAYESEMSVWAAVMAHANMIYHGAGWMEGGLTASFEKVILDAELLQMIARVVQPVTVDEDTLGFDAIREVPSGGHFFGIGHTIARFETAFYHPFLSDWRNYENWVDAGAEDATRRATRIWQGLLKGYEKPPMDEGVRDALEAFVARRKSEIQP
ncbi:MAG: trimethylamine methyltransferase family protein [Gammaproteobacteria bacterium]|nr:trimethylamine methyltransferase family protein [Gammaproteobacteria bacterium]